MAIQVFDLDGTLTYGFGDIPNTTDYSAYSYWQILSLYFVNDQQAFHDRIGQWRRDIKKHSDLGNLAQKAMQKVVDDFRADVHAAVLSEKAEAVTMDFIQHGVIRLPMVEKLQASLQQGDTTVITSGSYIEAVQGFVKQLVQADLLDAQLAQQLHLVGATIDWPTKQLIHSNVHQHKIAGLEKVLQLSAAAISQELTAVYGDDPWVNDAGIFSLLTEGKGYVIPTQSHQHKALPPGLVRLKM